MIICSRCTTQNDDGVKFCAECGNPLSENVMATNPEGNPQWDATNAAYSPDGTVVVPTKPKRRLLPIIALIIVAVIAVVAIVAPGIQEEKKRQELIDSINNSSVLDTAESLFKSSMSSFSPRVYFDEENMEYIFEVTVDAVSKSDLDNYLLKSSWQEVVESNLSLANTFTPFFEEYEGVDVVYITYSKFNEEILVIRNGKVEYNAAD